MLSSCVVRVPVRICLRVQVVALSGVEEQLRDVFKELKRYAAFRESVVAVGTCPAPNSDLVVAVVTRVKMVVVMKFG